MSNKATSHDFVKPKNKQTVKNFTEKMFDIEQMKTVCEHVAEK